MFVPSRLRPTPLAALALILASALPACGEPDSGSDCNVDGVNAGAIEATVDGEAWNGGVATWMVAGSSLQVNSASSGDWWLSAVAQEAADGATLAAKVGAGDWPANVELAADGTGGWATFYPPSGDSYSTKQAAGGTLVIASQDGTDLLGCFAFVAANGDGNEVTVESGRFRATGG